MNIVLAIAEDRAICESLRAALPKSDLLLIENTLDEALRRLVSVKVDLILLDDSPHLGIRALRAVAEETPDTPVIIISGRSDGESLASYTRAGARAHLLKPFNCDDLAVVTNRCIGARHAARVQDLPAVASVPRTASIIQYQMALRWMTRNTGRLEDVNRLLQSMVDALVDIFDTVRTVVLMQTNGTVKCVASHGVQQHVVQSIQLQYSVGLMRWLEENTCLFDRDVNRDATDALKEIQVLGGRLAVPLVSFGRTCGAILLGEKASGAPYSTEERDLLVMLARGASSCLEKANQYRDAARQQTRLDAVLANITAGVVTVRPDKTVSMMNESAERILQLRAVDVLGRSVQKLGSAFADVVLRTLNENKPRVRQSVRDMAINKTLGVSTAPLGPEGVAAIFSLIPGDAKGEQDDIAYSPMWEYLASRVAQEIKNPMVAINTFAQLLPRRHESEEFRRDFSEVVLREVARINNVVETLFDFARHPRLSTRLDDLNFAVKRVMESFDDELKSRHIRVEADLTSQELSAEIDSALFTTALRNIVRNSIEAMSSNGGTLRIKTERSNGDCKISVYDSGPGISEQDAKLVFLPFFSTKERGMGLGLTLAARIMEQHHGRLELLANGEGGGAFAFSLPAAAKAS